MGNAILYRFGRGGVSLVKMDKCNRSYFLLRVSCHVLHMGTWATARRKSDIILLN